MGDCLLWQPSPISHCILYFDVSYLVNKLPLSLFLVPWDGVQLEQSIERGLTLNAPRNVFWW